MLDLDTRMAILRLAKEGHGRRKIAKALNVSANAVRAVIRSGEAEVPRQERPEVLAAHIERIRELYGCCKGNLVRVWEELRGEDVDVSYSGLTAFCRRHGIGVQPKKASGKYTFDPGEEMQHDTSPHEVVVARKRMPLNCASLVLCYSRLMYAQVYRRWTRFECRVFLTEALRYFGGAAGRNMIDNSSVIIARGTGKDAVPADEMLAFAERFGFDFEAHELGDANRSARVERRFDYIDNNFYAGRDFADLDDLNAQMRAWCDRVNDTPKRYLKASPRELHAVELPVLRPLPLHIPEVYDLHSRRVDVEGFINLHRNRYSVPVGLIGRRVEIRESIDRVRVFDGHQLVAEHARDRTGADARHTLPEHREDRRRPRRPPPPSPEERELRAIAPELGVLCDRLRIRHGGQALRAVRRLRRMYLDYPSEPLLIALRKANDFGLTELERIDQMVLRQLAGDFFRLPLDPDTDTDTSEKDDDHG